MTCVWDLFSGQYNLLSTLESEVFLGGSSQISLGISYHTTPHHILTFGDIVLYTYDIVMHDILVCYIVVQCNVCIVI